MQHTPIIYGLYDPRTSPSEIRYIGFTSKGQKRRLFEHHAGAFAHPDSHRAHWLLKLQREGIKATLVVLEEIEDGVDWQERERFWIQEFREGGGKSHERD